MNEGDNGFTAVPFPRMRQFVRDAGWLGKRKHIAGTVGLTSVGMFGNGRGWGLGLPVHSLALTLGGIAEKPAWVDGRIEPHEFLYVTLSFDHDVIDGTPAARFANTFRELVETEYGLHLN